LALSLLGAASRLCILNEKEIKDKIPRDFFAGLEPVERIRITIWV